jgi:hypothetical protein
MCGLIATGCGPGDTDATPTHEVVLQPLALLAGVGDSIDIGQGVPAIDSHGYIAVLLDYPPSGAVGIYDSTGRFVQRIGRSGGGPGEFLAIQGIGFGPGDSLIVIDQMRRGHVFTPAPTWEYVRSFVFERPNTGIVTPSGILSAGVVTSAGAALAHLADWAGQFVREFGASVPADDKNDRMKPPGFADSAHVWMPHANEYVLELLGADGDSHARVQRRVSWFPTDSSERERHYPGGWLPTVHAVSVGANGLLWTIVRRANRAAPRPGRAGGGATSQPVEASTRKRPNLADIFESVVEALDPRTGQLVATHEASGGVLGFAGPDILAEMREDDLGHIQMQLWRLTTKAK